MEEKKSPYKNGQTRGQPSKYEDDFPVRILEYIATCSRVQTRLPKRVDIALMLGVDEWTLRSWEDQELEDGTPRYPEFRSAIRAIDMAQKSHLIDDGLYGGKEVNASVSIFLLKANHGMIETEKRILSSDPEAPLIVFDVSTEKSIAGNGSSTKAGSGDSDPA